MAESKQKLINKKSSVKGRIASPEIVDYGEIQVNFNAENTFLTTKRADDTMAVFYDNAYIDEIERVTAAALVDLEDRKFDKVDFNVISDVEGLESLTSAETGYLVDAALFKNIINEDEYVTAEALNNLNARIIELSARTVDTVTSEEEFKNLTLSDTGLVPDAAMLSKVIIDDEYVISTALNDHKNRIEELEASVADLEDTVENLGEIGPGGDSVAYADRAGELTGSITTGQVTGLLDKIISTKVNNAFCADSASTAAALTGNITTGQVTNLSTTIKTTTVNSATTAGSAASLTGNITTGQVTGLSDAIKGTTVNSATTAGSAGKTVGTLKVYRNGSVLATFDGSSNVSALTVDTIYTHPTFTAKTGGLYKIAVNGEGHVTGTTAVTKSDITGLGIPGSDTTYSNATTGASGIVKLVNGDLNGKSYAAGEAAAAAHSHSNYALASHTHSASQITSGTFAIDRIPTGTSSSTVAKGDHTHSDYSLTSHTHSGYVAVNGTVNGTITFSGNTDSNGIFTGRDNYCSIGSSSAAFYQGYINNIYADSITIGGVSLNDYIDTRAGGGETYSAGSFISISSANAISVSTGTTSATVARGDHTHSNYSPTGHTHSNYALTSHTHTGYAASDHNHSGTYHPYGGSSSINFSAATVTAVGYYQTSDEHLKDFGDTIKLDYEALKKIPKKYFTWKDGDPTKIELGTSAQKVKEEYPEIVDESGDGTLSVDYSKLAIVALRAVDDLNERLERLEKLLLDKD